MNEFHNVSEEELAAVDGGSIILAATLALIVANPLYWNAALIAAAAK